ncbi:SDR family NAD(P)-dependent oxidoreductase [Haladaptatus caseinilyticus]|uniref:SDR family NAD(P)-dependent oxidoreductase n=1 Tax=Haladaptatus caseinilyticus TaxID=2993314 RepID=UPI00224AED60|nr:SDR family NAD(P)-dependent oxidoreductase [Haladaptatus caseinilyticus]
MSYLEGKTVLVTGGGGFIGSTLVKRIAEHDPDEIRTVDIDENGLVELKRQVGQNESINCLLGDLRDKDRIKAAMNGVEVVFHAAALKHTDFSEHHPFEAVKTNIDGSRNLIEAALAEGVESLTAISTDKASNPASVMGATKFLMERLISAANKRHHMSETNLNCVRFGNVLGSTGSVVPLFLDQIKHGGPITVTDPDMTRFIMSVDRAVDLVIDASAEMKPGEISVLKMPAFRVGDLAEVLRNEYAPEFGYDPSDIEIELIGKRPGERIHEKLISRDVIDRIYETENKYIIAPQLDLEERGVTHQVTNCLTGEYTSADTDLLSPSELISEIRNYRDESQPTGKQTQRVLKQQS